jgi:hypothetical protein
MSSRLSRSPSIAGGITPVQHRYMLAITQKIARLPISRCFLNPVDPIECPNYTSIVKTPMHLTLVLERLEGTYYTTADQWKQDMLKIWKNATTFNPADSVFYKMAEEFKAVFLKRAENLPRTEIEEWVVKMRRVQAKLAEMMKYG